MVRIYMERRVKTMCRSMDTSSCENGHCGKLLGYGYTVEVKINKKTELFCSEDCAKKAHPEVNLSAINETRPLDQNHHILALNV
jgi:hypothetical protein